MTFPNISTTIHSMLKMTQLNMKWQERKQDPQKPKEDESPKLHELRELQQMAEKSRKASYSESLKTKLKCGGDLTPVELDYLKANHPDLYQDAVETRQEREQYKRELENCRTQEEVDRLNINRMNGFVSQAKSIVSNPNIPQAKKLQLLEKITAKVMGIQADFNKFVKAGHYDSLPSEEDSDKKHKTKRKAAQTDEPQDSLLIANNAKVEIEKELAALVESEKPTLGDGVSTPDSGDAPPNGTANTPSSTPQVSNSETENMPSKSDASPAPASTPAPQPSPTRKSGGFSVQV